MDVNKAHFAMVKHKGGKVDIYKNGALELTIEESEECTIQHWYWDDPSHQVLHNKKETSNINISP